MENYIYPFLWMKGEKLETVFREIDAIENAQVKGVCLESRTYEDFCKESWWSDIGAILKECKGRGMKVWLLDDKHFPTGYANGILEDGDSKLLRNEIAEYHIDICGPIKNGVAIVEGWCKEEEKLLAVLLCKRSDLTGKLTGEVVNVTDRVRDGLVYLDLEEGMYRLVYLILTRERMDSKLKWYIDPLDKEAVSKLIEAVYESHWQHFSEYFGDTFESFFSDEPGLEGRSIEHLSLGKVYTAYPWTRYMLEELEKEYGEDPFRLLPGLWFEFDHALTAKARIGYMNVVTRLYRDNFSMQIGEWCRKHNVKYVGHTIEDNNFHTMLGSSTGHYFRGMAGQDFAGIDIVLNQIVPGITNMDHPYSGGGKFDVDYTFYQFVLAKLGVSAAYMDKHKKGRVMCEIFGANGWAEGSKMMKWLTDHCLVRGINYFVPHAFCMEYPCTDCPPHFYGQGKNPQYEGFREVMRYMNAACSLRENSKVTISAVILYHAEAEWSGFSYDRINRVAENLAQNQLDYMFLPADLIGKIDCDGKRGIIGEQIIPMIIVPYSECLSVEIIEQLANLKNQGIPVCFIDNIPSKIINKDSDFFFEKHHLDFQIISLEELPAVVRSLGDYSVLLQQKNPEVRVLNFKKNNCDMFFLFNENIYKEHKAIMNFPAHEDGEYVVVDLLESVYEKRYPQNGNVELLLQPYHMVVLIWGADKEKVAEKYAVAGQLEVQKSKCVLDLNDDWNISVAENGENYITIQESGELINLTQIKPYNYFGGYIKYKKNFTISNLEGKYYISLGNVGESVSLKINGIQKVLKIVQPYIYDITEELKNGVNHLEVVVANHLGYKHRDRHSHFILMEQYGLVGPVRIIK